MTTHNELVLVAEEDGTMAWNGDHGLQIVAELGSDGYWAVRAEHDGDVLLTVDQPVAQGSLATWVDTCYADALPLAEAWEQAAELVPEDAQQHHENRDAAVLWFVAYEMGREMRESHDAKDWAHVLVTGMPPLTKASASEWLADNIADDEEWLSDAAGEFWS